MPLAPGNSPLQNQYARERHPPVPKNCLVTGGTGFVGQRLVEMLVERGAERVVSLDIVPPPSSAWTHPNIQYEVGDICNADRLTELCKGIDCVFHIAAAVGPFHPKELYTRVNYHGTLNVIQACKNQKVPKLVMSSSPSTRFTGEDINGLTEDELPKIPQQKYMQEYAASKALGEIACLKACCPELLTVAVAPHQVYGPRDNLFMPNLLETAGNGRLRIFAKSSTGWGKNRVCFTHVDNYCHGLILGELALHPQSPALGKFYIVTDGDTHTFQEGYAYLWDALDEAVIGMGFTSLWSKFKYPYWLLMGLAYICNFIGWVLHTQLKLNPFNVTVLTMHRWFRISAAERDLKYKPIVPFNEGWKETIKWFRQYWLPGYIERKNNSNFTGIAAQSQRKIDIQAGKKA